VKQRVPESAAGERLDRFLASIAEVGSRSVAERLLEGGEVLVDGRRLGKSHRLTGGEVLEFEPLPRSERGLVPEAMDLRIAYEDEHLVVVDKPAGVVVHPAPGHATGTLVHGLMGLDVAGGDTERPGIVHRHYLALVVGRPRSRSGRIEAPIGRDRRDPLRHSLDTDTPRDAVTHFDVLELLARHALLDVRLETGRTHQIRVHLAAIDLPVAGDPVYGRPRELDLDRQFLHAARLAFTHPFTNERVEVTSPLPRDLTTALQRARAEQ
jgi:23S rRNA pseudouridine1911/1915/1917 synthase